MKKTLKTLFEKSITLGDQEYTNEQINSKWLGGIPATKGEIKNTEERLGLNLPLDYIELVTIANGFLTCSNSVEPSFQNISDIDFYKNFQWNVIDTWKEMGDTTSIVTQLENAIMIGGLNDEQQFLLIPPSRESGKWKYWKFAMWIPGEEDYNNLNEYFNSIIEFLDEEI